MSSATVTKTSSSEDLEFDIITETLYSHDISIFQLRTQLKKWIYEYQLFIKESDVIGLKYITVDKCENKLSYKLHTLKSDKKFNNLFFDNKQILIDRLDIFQNRQDLYKKVGIPHNLGLMFHGTPGCGKTSCIKAIANYLNRHILEINLSQIQDITDLQYIFYQDTFNNTYIPIEKRIIIIEDIDCMIDIVKQRSDTEHDVNTAQDIDKSIKLNDIENAIVDKIIGNDKKKHTGTKN